MRSHVANFFAENFFVGLFSVLDGQYGARNVRYTLLYLLGLF